MTKTNSCKGLTMDERRSIVKRTQGTISRGVIAIAIAALTTASMAGCIGGGKAIPTASPTPKGRTGVPVLRVPEKTTDDTVSLVVNGGSLKAGTRATIYGYADDKFGTEVSCTTETNDQMVSITGKGADQTVAFPVYPGLWHWVLAAGKYVSGCGVKGSTTRVLYVTDLSINVESNATVGKPTKISPFSTKYGNLSLPVTITAFGPYSTLPETLAESCGGGTVAWKDKVSITTGAGVASADVTFTPEKAGVYRIVANAAETPQSSAVDGCTVKATTLSVGEEK